MHHTLHSHHLIWESGITSPQLQGRNRAGLRRFPNRSPPHQGLDPATELTPTPWEPDAGAAPQGHPPPDGNKASEGLPETRPWVPREVGGPRGRAGRHYGEQRAML